MEDDEQTKWVVEIQEDPITGEAILEFPQEVLEKTKWQEGDTLVWRDLGDGAWMLEKKANV